MRKCPHCDKELSYDQGMARNEEGKLIKGEPTIGDVTICCECGEFCEFGVDNALLKITDKKKLKELEHHQDAMMAKKIVDTIRDHKKHDSYLKQIKTMALAVREWVENHPGSSPAIQRNSTSTMCIIATLKDAIQEKFVSVNEDCSQMIKDLGWLKKGELMPTVLMVEMAMEHAFTEFK